jgi:glucose-6-phosphate-specific signal transduction histidine kinase
VNVIKPQLVKQYGILAIAGASYLALTYVGLRISCPIHSLTGVFCPGCGSTRAARALLRGDLELAIHNNALLLISPVLVLAGVLISKYSKNRIWLYLFLSLLLAVVIAFTVLRNQPGSEIAPL